MENRYQWSDVRNASCEDRDKGKKYICCVDYYRLNEISGMNMNLVYIQIDKLQFKYK